MTEDEMVGWYPRLDGHESEKTQGNGVGQRGLAWCSSWGHKESDMTEQLNSSKGVPCQKERQRPNIVIFDKKLSQNPGVSLVAQMVLHLPAVRETWARSLGREDPLEKEMATHSSTLAWKIPWTEEPGRLQPMGSQRVGHN